MAAEFEVLTCGKARANALGKLGWVVVGSHAVNNNTAYVMQWNGPGPAPHPETKTEPPTELGGWFAKMNRLNRH